MAKIIKFAEHKRKKIKDEIIKETIEEINGFNELWRLGELKKFLIIAEMQDGTKICTSSNLDLEEGKKIAGDFFVNCEKYID